MLCFEDRTPEKEGDLLQGPCAGIYGHAVVVIGQEEERALPLHPQTHGPQCAADAAH